jgi:tetratricopeptide (TPR) repeat protein
MRHLLALLAIVALAAGPASAQMRPEPPSRELLNRARKHYEAGRALYQVGKYEQALVEFDEGFRLTLRVNFLINLAQCYRQLGRIAEARAHYEKYAALAPADDPMRQEVQQILAALPPPEPLAPKPEPTPAPREAVSPPPAQAESRPPWQRDPAAATLLATGAAALVVGVALVAWSSDQIAHHRDDYDRFLTALGAEDTRIAGSVVLGAGGLLMIGGGLRYGVVRGRAERPIALGLGVVRWRF